MKILNYLTNLFKNKTIETKLEESGEKSMGLYSDLFGHSPTVNGVHPLAPMGQQSNSQLGGTNGCNQISSQMTNSQMLNQLNSQNINPAYNQIQAQGWAGYPEIKRKPHEAHIQFKQGVNPRELINKLMDIGVDDYEIFILFEIDVYSNRRVDHVCVNTRHTDLNLIRLTIANEFPIENCYLKQGY